MIRLQAVVVLACAGLIGATLHAAHAQQSSVPVVGLLRSTPSAPFGHIVAALRAGLADEGLKEGINVRLEQRWAENKRERLPSLAAELLRRKVSVIVGNSLAVEAARAATETVPIVFVTSDDPVKRGLVRSLARPGGNITGLTFFGGGQLGAKRLQLLSEMAPGRDVAFIGDPNFPAFKAERVEVESAARANRRRITVLQAGSAAELEAAFKSARASGVSAVMISGSPLFTSHRKTLIELAARYRLPAIYDVRAFAAAGGLMSYSASFADAYRQAGRYAGRIVKGAKPAELPVLQPTKFELVINQRTARALGLVIPQTLLATADEVIE
jgi:putative ABC transport system substrate-binding protein